MNQARQARELVEHLDQLYRQAMGLVAGRSRYPGEYALLVHSLETAREQASAILLQLRDEEDGEG